MNKPLIRLDFGNVAALSEPLSKLIDVIARGTGIGPLGTILQAKADAKAKRITTRSEIADRALIARAQARIDHREAIRQKNIERIYMLSSKELPKTVSSAPVDQDWILQFFDQAQDVCDEDLQGLWAKILAREVACPGSCTRRTLQFLKTMEKADAIKFSELCFFSFTDDQDWHYVMQNEQTLREIREKLGVGDYVAHFISIGLIATDAYLPAASAMTGLKFNYFGRKYVFEGPPKPEERAKFPILEHVCPLRAFSQIGQQLAKIANAQPIDGYVERLSESLSNDIRVSLREGA